jgi:hypothetical protein
MDQIPVKTTTADIGITQSSAYRFKKSWESKHEATTYPVHYCVGSYVPMNLEEMINKLLIEFSDLTVTENNNLN